MPLIADILKSVGGSANCSINIKGKEAAVISLEGKELLLDVKDPFAFMDLGLIGHFMKGRGSSSGAIGRLKEAGFRVRLKYKGFKVDL